jgi:hypothetical protein
MNSHSWRSTIKTGVAVAVLLGLLFLLVAPAHHSVSFSALVFLPVFFAGAVVIPAVLGRLKEADPLVPTFFLSISWRFQLPPPVATA